MTPPATVMTNNQLPYLSSVIEAKRTHSSLKFMDILFILIPLSVALGLLILGALGWAVWRGQFDNIEAEGERVLRSD
jgi:cbb3-type cytochrome oxidase maturation protein